MFCEFTPHFSWRRSAGGDFITDPSEMEFEEEANVKSPPPSLVPRLHAVITRRLAHSNPHLPLDVNAESSKQGVCVCVCVSE